MGSGNKISLKMEEQILKYYGQGVTLSDTAAMLGISQSSVYRTWMRIKGKRRKK